MIVSEEHQKYGNIIIEKSFDFSVRVIKFYSHLKKKNRELDSIYKQLLRSGTSIGANISEAQSAFTKKDFINKLGISLKEARETEYWLRLLNTSEVIDKNEFDSMYKDCIEIIKLLTSIIKSAKLNNI